MKWVREILSPTMPIIIFLSLDRVESIFKYLKWG